MNTGEPPELQNNGGFLLDVNAANVNEEKARALLQLLQAKYKTVKAHLLVQNPPAAGIPKIAEENLWLLPLQVPEPWVWSGDDDAWSEMFRRVTPQRFIAPAATTPIRLSVRDVMRWPQRSPRH